MCLFVECECEIKVFIFEEFWDVYVDVKNSEVVLCLEVIKYVDKVFKFVNEV